MRSLFYSTLILSIYGFCQVTHGEYLLRKWMGILEVRGERCSVHLRVVSDGDQEQVFTTIQAANIYDLSMGRLEEVSEGQFRAGFFVGELKEDAFDAVFEYYEKKVPVVFERTDEIPRDDKQVIDIPRREPDWSFEIGGSIRGKVLYLESTNRVVFGSDDGVLYFLKGELGQLDGTLEIGSPIDSSPVLLGEGRIAVFASNGVLHIIDTKKMASEWSYSTGKSQAESVGWERYAPSPVRVSDHQLIFAAFDGKLRSLDPRSKTIAWELDTGGAILGNPAISNGNVVVATKEGLVKAYGTENGDFLWERSIHADTPCSPLIYDGMVYLGSRNADIWVLSLQTGEVIWRRFLWTSWVESSVVEYEGNLYVGSSDIGEVYCLNPADGDVLWKRFVGGSPWSTPVLWKDRLWIGVAGAMHYSFEHEGSLVCLDRRSGEFVWKNDYEKPVEATEYTNYGVVASPVIANGWLYVGDLEGKMMAFDVNDG